MTKIHIRTLEQDCNDVIMPENTQRPQPVIDNGPQDDGPDQDPLRGTCDGCGGHGPVGETCTHWEPDLARIEACGEFA